jgi:ElaB/YqjD/DUF883 family membrane-anchored ribosome-binding protein
VRAVRVRSRSVGAPATWRGARIPSESREDPGGTVRKLALCRGFWRPASTLSGVTRLAQSVKKVPTMNTANGNNGEGTTTTDGLTESARHLVTDAAHTAREKLDAARVQVEDMAGRAAETARDLSRQARGSLTKLNEAVVDFVRERPFVALGTAFVAGYLTISLLRRR